MKTIKDNSEIWYSLDCLRGAYVNAIVCDEMISPDDIGGCIRNIMQIMLGDDAVEKMDLEIAKRKIGIHDIKLKSFKYEILKLRKEVNELENELEKELNSRTASKDKNEGGDG